MKKLSTALLTLVLGASAYLLSPMATAGPDLCDLTTDLGPLPCIPDSQDEFFSVSDIDGNDDDITSFILDRNAGFSNAAGLYDPFNLGNSLELWSGAVAPGFSSGVVLNWDGTDTYTIEGTLNSLTLSTDPFKQWFGMYIDVFDGASTVRYYSDASQNAGGDDHLSTYNTEGGGGATNGFDIVFAWEDLPNLGDADYNDLIYGCIDCESTFGITAEPVPVPGSLGLLGGGLSAMGLVAIRRRNKRAC